MEHTKHLWRAILLIVLIVVVYLLGRGFLVPGSFGEFGHYRGDALREEMNVRVPNFGAGVESCAACHDERAEEFRQSAHKTINCEVCHAPLRTHVEYEDIESFIQNPDQYEWTNEMVIKQAKDLCIRCHEAQPAKPHDFPHVTIVEHLEEMGVENSADVCVDCHDPHDPSM